MMENGSARLGMMVADTLRRNTKITITINPSVSIMVNFTSSNDSLIVSERSYKVFMFMDGGNSALIKGKRSFTPFATSIVFVPGWR